MRTLVLLLISLRVTLLELLGELPEKRGRLLLLDGGHQSCAFCLHLRALFLSHHRSVDQVLKGGEGMIHQLLVQGINQSTQETILSLGISVDIFRSIAGQLQKSICVLTN
jgi:hypothetical protein